MTVATGGLVAWIAMWWTGCRGSFDAIVTLADEYREGLATMLLRLRWIMEQEWVIR